MSQSIARPIVGFHLDDQGHWVADLACGHQQHVRHDPPLVRRDWVLSDQGRAAMIGHPLNCMLCGEAAELGGVTVST